MSEKVRGSDSSSLSSATELEKSKVVFTDEATVRRILAMNPMCTGHEEIPESVIGRILVDWDGPDDPRKPRNWPVWRKVIATLLISLCTTSLYMGAAIVTAAQTEIQEYFHTTRTKGALDITLFVWGYGLGSLWFTPMSEIPCFRGRNPVYYSCQFLFAILQIPTALSHHLGGFAVLRFLGGIFASPPLSTTAATISDMWDMPAQVLALILWAFGAVAGPFLGPLIGAALTLTHPFSYIFWYLLAVSGGMLILMLLLLPETSEQELIMRKAIKMRKTTGDQRYIAPGEVLMKCQKPAAVLKEMFFKPIKMTIVEPVLLLMDIHIGLAYSIMYLYLEAMPIVYIGVYHFNTVKMGLCFLAFLVGCAVGATLYILYVGARAKAMGSPEKVFGPSAILGSIFLPMGVLIWGWLSREGIHWALGFIGNFFFSLGTFLIFQSYFAILGTMYPSSTVGSAFASNNIVRSFMGGAFPLFGTIVYTHTAIDRYPVGWGCTILCFIGILLIPLPIFITIRGKQLREYAQQKYARNIEPAPAPAPSPSPSPADA